MKRFIYIAFRQFFALQRWLITHFTPAGRIVLWAFIACGVVGIDTNRTMAYQSFTFLGSLLLTAIITSRFFRMRCSVDRKMPLFATVGQNLTYRINVKNLTDKIQKGLYLSEDFSDNLPDLKTFINTPEPGEHLRNLFDRKVCYHRWIWLIKKKQGIEDIFRDTDVALPALSKNSSAEVSVDIVPSRRGRLMLNNILISRPDPLGLFKSFVRLSSPQSLLVLPKRYKVPDINLPGSRKYQAGGVALAGSVGESNEFVSLRDYRPGDPMRWIHWKSMAKTGKPVVLQYQEEFFVRHALILDTFQKAAYSEVFEEAVSLASSFACSIMTQESLLDLIFVGPNEYCFTAGRGLSHTDKILEVLSSVSPCTDKPFDTLPPLVLARASNLSGCICIFLAWDKERESFINQLRSQRIPLLAFVITNIKRQYEEKMPEYVRFLELGKIQEGLIDLRFRN